MYEMEVQISEVQDSWSKVHHLDRESPIVYGRAFKLYLIWSDSHKTIFGDWTGKGGY